MAQTPYPQTDRELMRLIERSAGHRAGYKQLIRELGLGGGRERRLLVEQLARITARGELVKIDHEQWSLPASTPEKTERTSRSNAAQEHGDLRATRDRLLAGRLDLHRDGYGFVRPTGSVDRADDLFIPPSELNGAMQGDEVLVDEAPPGRDGRRSGRVARILNRRNPTIVGIFHYARTHARASTWNDAPLVKGNYITPLDERMASAILIPDRVEIPAAAAETLHRVMGEEAKARAAYRLNPDVHNPLEGLAVDVEITDFPAPGRPARGRILEILGHPDDFGVDVEIVIRKHHLPHVFPANVLAEAQASAAQTVDTLNDEERAQRVDFRGLPGCPIVTIDGETARDFDDAVRVQELPNGNWQLQVHIADVSHYVRPSTALDLEARLRGTSVYFPDRAVPMLPPELSSGMCSLRPDEDRLVLSCIAEIDAAGEVVEYQVCEGIIRSARRMTYTQVQSILDTMDGAEDTSPAETDRDAKRAGDLGVREEFTAFANHFEQMYRLARRLNKKRVRRGSIDFDLPEPVIQFNPEGNMMAILRSTRGWSHRLIEEFMLTANECVAHWIEASATASLYRIHEMPDAKRILEFEETAASFGYSLGLSSLAVKTLTTKTDRRDAARRTERSGRNVAVKTHEVTGSIQVTPQMYQNLTAKIAGTPEERILSFLMLRSLKQARYAEKNEGHFALASPSYTHFTSPIRRYPDLIVHRLLRALIHAGLNTTGEAILSTDAQPWQKKLAGPQRSSGPRSNRELAKKDLAVNLESGHLSTAAASGLAGGLIPQEELVAIATESSQAERRADDAERELMEWKKIRFMQDRIGDEFSGIVLSCTKYGFFVELDELFIEGLVPLATLYTPNDDRYMFRDTDRAIVGVRTGHTYKMGMRVRVLLDRIDRQARRLQFAVLLSAEELAPKSLRKPKALTGAASADGERPHSSPKRTGKSKARLKSKKTKSKGKRR